MSNERKYEIERRYPSINFHRTMERVNKNGEKEYFFVYRTVWKHVDGDNYNIEVILPVSFLFDRKQDFEITYIRSKDVTLSPRKYEEDKNISKTTRAISSIAEPRSKTDSTFDEYIEYIGQVDKVHSGQEIDIIFPGLNDSVRNIQKPLKDIVESVSYSFHRERFSKEIFDLFHEIERINRNSVNRIISEIEKIYEMGNFKLRAVFAIILNLLRSINDGKEDNFNEIREKIFRLLREINPSFVVKITEEEKIEPVITEPEDFINNPETIDENTPIEKCKEVIAVLLQRSIEIGDFEIPFYLQLRIRNEIKIGVDVNILILIINYLRVLVKNRTTIDNSVGTVSSRYYEIKDFEKRLRVIFQRREIASANEAFDNERDRNRLNERIRGCIRKALATLALAVSLSCVAFSCIAAGSVAGRIPLFEIIKDIINRLIGILQNLVREITLLIEGVSNFTEEIKIRILELIQEASEEFKRVIKEAIENGRINPNDADLICRQFDLCIDDIKSDVEDGDVGGVTDKLRALIGTIEQANPPFLNGRGDSSDQIFPGRGSVSDPVVPSSTFEDAPYGLEPTDIPFDPVVSFNNPLSPAESFNKLGVRVSLRSHSVNGEDVIVLVAYDKNGKLTNVPSEVGLYTFGENNELSLINTNSVSINGIEYFYTPETSAASISPYGRHGLVP